MSLFWLSFADATLPKGKQFLGACIVPGGDTGDLRTDLAMAIKEAWRLGCNPGGQVAHQRVPPTVAPHIGPQWLGRLLTREDAQRFDVELRPFGVS